MKIKGRGTQIEEIEAGIKKGGQFKFTEELEVGFCFKEAQFDADNLVIRNAAVLGAISKNGYTYSENAMRSTARLAEGAKQYIGHMEHKDERSVTELFSVLKNVRYLDTEKKVRGDMHLVDTPEVREEIFPRMQHFKDIIGNSVVVWAEGAENEGVLTLTEVYKVDSVDLVTDPATNAGIFENVSKKSKSGGSKTMEITIEDVRKDSKIMEALRAEFLKESDAQKELDALKAENAAQKATIKTLTEKADKLETADKLRKKQDYIAAKVKEAKLPKEAVSEDWLNHLLNKCESEAEIDQLIADKKALVDSLTKSEGTNFEYDPDKVTRYTGEDGEITDAQVKKTLDRFDGNAFN